MLKRFILLLLVFIPFLVSAQRGYIANDSCINSGLLLKGGKAHFNARYCQWQKGDSLIQFGPKEISEYGFEDGRVYVAKEINYQDRYRWVFLERLVKGEIQLYMYHDGIEANYYIEIDHQKLVGLPNAERGDERQILRDTLRALLPDCLYMEPIFRVARFRERPLKYLVESGNTCEIRTYIHPRMGIGAAYCRSKWGYAEKINNVFAKEFEFSWSGSFIWGLFIDYPVQADHWFIHTGLYYGSDAFALNSRYNELEFDYLVETSSFQTPLLLRYSFSGSRLRPFVSGGGWAMLHARRDEELYRFLHAQDQIELQSRTQTAYVSSFQLGLAMGVGLEIPISYRRGLFIEVRTQKAMGMAKAGGLNRTEFQLLTGINF